MAVHHFPPRYMGGAELRAYRTAAWLQAHGHEVSVVCVEAVDVGNGKGVAYEDAMYDGLAVRRLSFNLSLAPDPFRWTYDNPWIGEHLHTYLREVKPDVLHLISGYMMSASTLRVAKDLGIPTVVTLTDFWWLCPRITLLRKNGQLCSPPFDAVTCARCLGEEKRRYRVPGQIMPAMMDAFWRMQSGRVAAAQARIDHTRETLNGVDAIISPSQFLRDLYIQAGVAAERITFSRQGRDFPSLRIEDLQKVPSEHLRLGYLGQIAPHKGIHVLFKAVRAMPDATLTVKAYGDGSHFPNYARRLERVARADVRLDMAGRYERNEVSRVFRELDVIVLPSVWYENSPNAILEAYAHRTPVIASRLGGMAELVRDGENGLLFAPGDAMDLARQLWRLLRDPGVLPALRKGIGPVKSVAQEMKELVGTYRRVTRRIQYKAEEPCP